MHVVLRMRRDLLGVSISTSIIFIIYLDGIVFCLKVPRAQTVTVLSLVDLSMSLIVLAHCAAPLLSLLTKINRNQTVFVPRARPYITSACSHSTA